MAIGSKIVLSWPPGSCGDMVRSCLYPLMHKGNWEYRQWEEHETPIFGWNTSGTGNAQNPKALVWNNNLISYNDNLGQTQTPTMWKHFRWNAFLFDKKELLGVTPSEADVNNIVYSIHKRHHLDTSMDMMIEIQNEAYRDDSLNPVVTYISCRDTKYLKLSQENWSLKVYRSNHYWANQEIGWWDKKIAEAIELRNNNPEKINHNVFELGDRKHMMFLDDFFEWETFRQELEWFIGFYDMEYIDNYDVVKQFWQAWRDEQRIKVE